MLTDNNAATRYLYGLLWLRAEGRYRELVDEFDRLVSGTIGLCDLSVDAGDLLRSDKTTRIIDSLLLGARCTECSFWPDRASPGMDYQLHPGDIHRLMVVGVSFAELCAATKRLPLCYDVIYSTLMFGRRAFHHESFLSQHTSFLQLQATLKAVLRLKKRKPRSRSRITGMLNKLPRPLLSADTMVGIEAQRAEFWTEFYCSVIHGEPPSRLTALWSNGYPESQEARQSMVRLGETKVRQHLLEWRRLLTECRRTGASSTGRARVRTKMEAFFKRRQKEGSAIFYPDSVPLLYSYEHEIESLITEATL